MNRRYFESPTRRQWLTTAFAMTAFSGCGGGDAPPPSDDPPADSVLFVVDANSGAVMGYSLVSPPIGTPFEGRHIGTAMPGARRIALDLLFDELYVLVSDRVLVYAGAGRANSQTNPSRTIILPKSEVSGYTDMSFDVPNNRLHVAARMVEGDDEVYSYDNAATLDGSPIPTSSYGPDNGAKAIAIDNTAGATLYATGPVKGISRYDNILSIGNFDTTPDAVLGQQSTGPSVAVDFGRDMLYIADGFGLLQVFRQASASPIQPYAVLKIPFISSVVVDSRLNRLYVGAGQYGFILDNASGITSATPVPLPVLVGALGVQISGFAFRSS